MKPFGYAVAPDLAAALAAIEDPDTLVIAGGTELVNWLKEGIVTPARLIDISKLPLGASKSGRTDCGSVRWRG